MVLWIELGGGKSESNGNTKNFPSWAEQIETADVRQQAKQTEAGLGAVRSRKKMEPEA